tara:strand:- start:894 stop:3311 length:2418 start_codon:yes stop_codon:yes gene_type:complete
MRSNVMRRRLFNNGGMGMTKPAASGILASSQPLVDVLAGQARDNLTNGINVGNQMYGLNVGNQMPGSNGINVGNQMPGSNVQGTNLMNQGGIANYAGGGVEARKRARDNLGVKIVPTGDGKVIVPVAGSKDMNKNAEEIVTEDESLRTNQGAGMFEGLTPNDIAGRSNAEGNVISRQLRKGSGAVQDAWRIHIKRGGSPTEPVILPDGTIIVGNADGTNGQIYVEGRTSGQGIYEKSRLVPGLSKENIGLVRNENMAEITTLPGDIVGDVGAPDETISETIESEKISPDQIAANIAEINAKNIKSEADLRDMTKQDSNDSNVVIKEIFGDEVVTPEGKKVVKEKKVIEEKKITPEGKKEGEEVVNDPYDFTDKDLYDAFGAESVATVRKEAANGNEKEVAKTMEDYKKEFTKNMPAYKGMTDEEKGNAWIKMGMAIAGGESPNAIVNISKGVLATIDEFADDPKEKRKYETRVGLAASKYAIESVASDRATEKTLETDFENYVVTEAGTITYPNGETIEVSPNQVVSVSTKNKLDGMDMSNLITTGMYDKDMDNIRALNAISVSTASAMRDEVVVKGPESESVTARYVLNMDKVISGQELKALVANSMEMNAETGVTGFNAMARGAMLKGFALAGVSPEIIGMDEKEAVDFLGSQQLYNDQMQIVANSMLKTLLGEGSKNISNVDRQLAQEISGLIKGMQAGLFQDETLLQNKLKRIYTLIDRNQEAALGQVQSIAREYNNRLVAGTDYSYYETILKPIFAEKETQLQTSRIPGSGALGLGELGTFSTEEDGTIMYTMDKSEPKS